MKTKIITINKEKCLPEDFTEAARILQKGGLVAFPTETVYGLGGDAMKEDAARKIYEAKGRPSDNPLIVHIANIESLYELAEEVPKQAFCLAEKFWPGPLTMIFKKKKEVPYSTTGGLDTVAVRMPSHPVALELIRTSKIMIAAPSANTSGRPSPTKAEHVREDLEDRIDMIIDGGSVEIGIESTIIDLSADTPIILRPGYITQKMIEQVIETVEIDKAILKKPEPGQRPKAPGMKYRHYAPRGNLTILEGETESVTERINKEAALAVAEGKKVGIIASAENKDSYKMGVVKVAGSRKNEVSIAQSIYSILREFDHLEVDVIFSESFTSDSLGQAIMNRLLKAAAYQTIHCE